VYENVCVFLVKMLDLQDMFSAIPFSDVEIFAHSLLHKIIQYMSLLCVRFRLEGKGNFTDTDGQMWTGNFRYKAAPGLNFHLRLE